MKKKIPIWTAIVAVALACALSVIITSSVASAPHQSNFTQEMKFNTDRQLNEDGADAYDRTLDHKGSPYFYSADIYNMQSTDTRFILPHFKTFNQTSWWSCGQSSVLMVLEHYGVRGDYDEKSLSELRTDHSDIHIGTCLDQMIETLEAVGGFELVTTYDYADRLDEVDMHFFREQLEAGFPVIIGWNDWGGHWEVVIGYDTMGTENEGDDVILIADPFDTSDHNQDGYGVISAERFISNFSFYSFFPEGHTADKCFIVVKPAQ